MTSPTLVCVQDALCQFAMASRGLVCIEAWLANSNQRLGFVLSISPRRRKESKQFEEEGTNAKHLDPPNSSQTWASICHHEYTTEKETYRSRQEFTNRIW